MEDKYNVPCFSSRGLFLVVREAITSFRWIGIVIVVWFLLQNSSNCQTTSEPAPILTLRADPRKFDPFTPKIAYSPTGRFIASWRNVSTGGGFFGYGGSSTDSELKIWDAATGKEVLSHPEPFLRIAYSPNEDVVLIASSQGTTVHSLADGQKIARLDYNGSDGMWFTQDGQICLVMAVSSGRKEIKLSDGRVDSVEEPRMVTLKMLSSKTWKEAPHPLNEIGQLYFWAAVSKNAKLVASFVKKDDGNATIKIWDLSTGEAQPSPDAVYPDLLFGPEFVCNDQVLLIPDFHSEIPLGNRLWHIEKGRWLEQREYIYPTARSFGHLLPFSASPGLTMDMTDSLLTVRDSATGKIRNQLSQKSVGRLASTEYINNFPLGAGSHFLNDDTLVLMSPRTRAGEVRICDLESGVQRSIEISTPVRQLVCSKDGRLVAFQTTSSADTGDGFGNRIELWDTIESRRKYEAKFPKYVSALALSPDDNLLVAANGGELCLVGTETRNEIDRITLDEHEVTDAMCFSHDGKLLYTLSRGRILVWNVKERRKLHSYEAGSGNQLTMSADGTRLAVWSSRSNGRQVSVIDCRDGHLISKHPANGDLKAVFFSSQGELVGITQEFSGGETAPYSASKVHFASSAKTKLEGVRSIGYPADAWSNRVAFDQKSGAIALSSLEVLKSDPASAVHVFGPTSGDKVFPIGRGEVFSVAFVNDGKSLIMGMARGEESSLEFIDLLHGTVKTTLSNHQFLAGSRSGRYFATRDSLTMNAFLWCESEDNKLMDLPSSTNLQFRPDEETFATANKGVVNIWRIPDHSLPPLTPP